MRLFSSPLASRALILVALLIRWPMEQAEVAGGAMLLASPVALAVPTTAQRWVVWYGDDDRVHRQQVDASGYSELQRSLRQAQEEDRHRLSDLATGYLRVDLQSVFAELAARQETFLATLFAYSNNSAFGTSFSLLGTALTAADKAGKLEDRAQALSIVQGTVADEVVSLFRAQLIAPETTLRALRTAADRSLALLRKDLLQDCDRYDRAFRGFVLESTTTMETLDTKAGWQVDIAWRPETATFRSLCAGLRYTDPGVYLAEASLLQAFANAEPPVRSEALGLVRAMATSALEVDKYTEDTTATLGRWGLSRNWAHPTAAFVSYIANTRILARRVGEQLDGRHWRSRFRETLRKAIEQLQPDLTNRLQHTCDEFIATELDRVQLGLAARGEGTWSMP